MKASVLELVRVIGTPNVELQQFILEDYFFKKLLNIHYRNKIYPFKKNHYYVILYKRSIYRRFKCTFTLMVETLRLLMQSSLM